MMPAPLSYTETSLATAMLETLADVATALAWTADGGAFPGTTAKPLVRAVYATERAYGVTDIGTATDVAKIEALAEREAWRAAMRAAASRYDASIAGGPSGKRSQLYQQCRANWLTAATAAAVYDDAAGVIGFDSPAYTLNPYGSENTEGEFG